jgi:hypothetical protein
VVHALALTLIGSKYEHDTTTIVASSYSQEYGTVFYTIDEQYSLAMNMIRTRSSSPVRQTASVVKHKDSYLRMDLLSTDTVHSQL